MYCVFTLLTKSNQKLVPKERVRDWHRNEWDTATDVNGTQYEWSSLSQLILNLQKKRKKIHAATSIEKKTTNNFQNKLLSLNKVN